MKFTIRIFLSILLFFLFLSYITFLHRHFFNEDPPTRPPPLKISFEESKFLAKLANTEPESQDELNTSEDLFVPIDWSAFYLNVQGEKEDKVKRILLYSGFRWWPQEKNYFNQILQCPVGESEVKCSFTEDRLEVESQTIDAIVHKAKLRFIKGDTAYIKRLKKIYYILESPHSARLKLEDENEFLASYWRPADFHTPYGKWKYFDTNVTSKTQDVNYAKGKSKLGVMLVSNCNSHNSRINYINELRKYINIDVFGLCGLPCPSSKRETCLEALGSMYKFYFAFENSNCRDYITEKFFINGLENNMIPVVMGADPGDYKAAAPANSYIHVEDFDSPRELAEYLKLLDHDEDVYNEYFKWKGTGTFVSVDFFCDLCIMLHLGDSVKVTARRTKGKIFDWASWNSRLCLKPKHWYWKRN